MKYTALSLMLLLLAPITYAKSYRISSPDKKTEVTVDVDKGISLAIQFDGEQILDITDLALELDKNESPGKNPGRAREQRLTKTVSVRPPVPVKNEEINASYNELRLSFKENYSLRVRVFDNGVSYRFETTLEGRIRVKDESAQLAFPTGSGAFIPGETGFLSHYEVLYKDTLLKVLDRDRICILPMLITTPSGTRVLITESDLVDYPGMFLAGDGSHRLRLEFPPVVLETQPGQSADRSEQITREADFIAETDGTRNFPWRIFMVSKEDKDLFMNEMVYLLSSENQIEDPTWIKPGKVAWDWWNALNVYDVDFKAGINTETYKYYIDFAAKYGLEYIILDEGWSPTTRLTETVPDIDLDELISYGRRKGVGIILWVLWKPLDENLEAILDQYEEWGVKGIKVDFMQRADQYMVNYYQRVAEAAAARKLLVDYHGAFKPSGLRTAWPNVISYEGVKGMENCKWSADISPEYDLSIPFIRMAAGPMDFTPGAMRNAQIEDFKISWNRPMSLGTRCHQLAMYAIFESPLQMLSDNPSNYLKDDKTTRFISRFPTVWDETIVFQARVADYLLLARRKGDIWYLGGMTDWDPREFELPLDFLPEGKYEATIMEDGINADRHAEDYRQLRKTVSNNETLKIKMAPGGGWAAILEPAGSSDRREPRLIKGELAKPEK